MMKALKNVFKPFLAIVVFLAVGVLSVCQKIVGALPFGVRRKYIDKLNRAKQKLYALVFNPYRIGNGIRPSFTAAHKPTSFDIEQCHQLILAKRKATS